MPYTPSPHSVIYDAPRDGWRDIIVPFIDALKGLGNPTWEDVGNGQYLFQFDVLSGDF